MNIEELEATIAKLQSQLVVQKAFKAGKRIEARARESKDTQWFQSTDPLWYWANTEYRIAEEPLVRWLTTTDGPSPGIAFESEEEADRYASGCYKHRTVRRFVEQPLPAAPTKGMNYKEAMEAVRRGTRVRRKSWLPGVYLFLSTKPSSDYGSCIWINEPQGNGSYYPGDGSIHATDWEEVS